MQREEEQQKEKINELYSPKERKSCSVAAFTIMSSSFQHYNIHHFARPKLAQTHLYVALI